MDLRAAVMVALIALSLWTGWHQFEARAVHPPDGEIAPAEPIQTDPLEAVPLQRGRWTLTPRADYDVTARILSREDYRFDQLADLIPEDLALGWGPMSDNRVLAAFEITQGARFYMWQPLRALPIPREDVISHSANTHVIPIDDHIRSELKRLRVGQVVHLTGSLVDGKRDDGASVRTSLVRTDSGAGACEILLVDTVEAH